MNEFNDMNQNIVEKNTNYVPANQDVLNSYAQPQPAIKKKKSSGIFKKAVVFTVCGALFGGAAGGTFTLVENYFDKDTEIVVEATEEELLDETAEANTDTTEEITTEASDITIPTTNTVSDGELDSQSLDVSDIAENVMPSVVAITIKSITEYSGFFGETYEYESEGSGSGIIIGSNQNELLIVTNNHVVSGAETVSVCFIDEEVYEAHVKGTDSDNDLAIIAVNLEDISSDTLSSIKIATIGSSDDIKVGEQVVAIGNALGYGQSVTTGIVSAKDRVVSTNTTPLIQTDAAINPGNSGGALLNMKGEVIGINSSKYASTEVEGMGYAIPISEVENILEELMNEETREKVPEEKRGYLGVMCQTVDEYTSATFGIPQGVLISDFTDNSAAKEAGMSKNSVITKIGRQSITSVEVLTECLEYYAAGEKISVTVMVNKDGEYVEETYEVVLGSQPKEEKER